MSAAPTSDVASFRLPRLLVGPGARHGIGAAARELGIQRPLLVTDPFHAQNGVAAQIADLLTESGLVPTVFSETVPDPSTSAVVAGLAAARDSGADAVIGVGGGSPIDTAKAIALLALSGGEMREYKAPVQTFGGALPILAVPTTAGSGSEATQFTVITDDTTHEKMLCAGPAFLPRVAIVDVELTLTMPPRLTADTGIDALTHAVEAYVSRKATPISDTFALRAMSLVGGSLESAYADGGDLRARSDMMLASLFAGTAFSNASVALVHGMSRPIGARFGIAHGLSNALLFPAVTRFSLAGAPERYAACAQALGILVDGDDAAPGAALVAELERLNAQLAVPTLTDLGVTAEDWAAAIPTMTEQAIASGSPANNPTIPTAPQIAELYAGIFR
ncbi:iron-containing alcohol dehydrogenase [Pseudolysinimonas sp.]|uniref:iron-containing alcohol dehydrogenase n=1 Tax=Pseudolysinimonas sp. TaxID=2680009 RepID=UPI003784D63A